MIANWAGNYQFTAGTVHTPGTVEQVQRLTARAGRVRALGTRHSFNGIADSPECLMSLQHLRRIVALDRERGTVTAEAGIRYGDLCRFLHSEGWALHNLASLPHISVAGACATATHGSGDRNGNLATAVRSMDIVTAGGDIVTVSRGGADGHFAGMAVGLGAFGIVVRMTLDIVPAFDMRQDVYERLPLSQLERHLDGIFAAGYSVSLFTDWKQPLFTQVWLKRRVSRDAHVSRGRNGASESAFLDAPESAFFDASGSAFFAAPDAEPEPAFFGALRAEGPLHPVPGHASENCTEQMGVVGSWHERLPHFRMEFTPSSGEELQSEYIVPRPAAYEALCEIDRLRERVFPLLHVAEVRSIAADDLWMSPCYRRDAIGIHFTWKKDWDAVRRVLPEIEERLAPFRARPHWAKLFTMPPEQLQPLYERLSDFRKLVRHYDPHGKFGNDFLDRYV